MKQFSALLLALCCFAFAGRASTVSGNVSYSGSVSAGGVKVYLYDSSFLSPGVVAIDSTITSFSGTYSMTATPISGHSYFLLSKVCNPYSYYFLGTFSSSVSANFTLSCSSIMVQDTVRNSTTGAPVWGQKVYLTNASATYRDSSYTGVSGVATFGVPPTYASGSFTVSTYACGLQSQTFTLSGAAAVAPTLYGCVSNGVISGTLTNLSTSSPIASYKVNIVDSSATAALWLDSTYTNASGAYSFTLPLWVPSGNMIAYAYTCGARIRNSAAFSGSSLTLNLSGCATSTATISGTVTNASTSAAIVGQKVYIYDSFSTTSIYRDSTITNAAGGYSFTIPPSITSGYMLVSAASCGSSYSFVSYTGSSAVANFSVITTPGTVSGTVNYYGGGKVAGANVQFTKAGFAPISTTANSVGAYSMTIPCSWGAGYISLYITAPGTNCNHNHGISYTGANMAGLADSLCYFGVSGVVSKQGGGMASNAKVYWVTEYWDSTTTPATVTLYAFDSTVTNASGAYKIGSDYMPSGPYNINYIKAALLPSDPAYLNFLPTYHDSALVWSGADTVKYSQWQSRATNVHVSLRAGVNPGGPGFISGNVLLGANKAAGVGDPLPGRILLLTTAAGKAVAFTYSDAAGKFSFSNLALGNYLLSGDAWGLKNPALAISLTQGHATENSVVFEENDKKFEGHLNATAVSGPTALEALRIYPNPVKDYVGISGLGAISGTKTVVLRNAMGTVVLQSEIPAGTVGEVGTIGLPAGIYMLQLQTMAGVQNFRFVKD